MLTYSTDMYVDAGPQHSPPPLLTPADRDVLAGPLGRAGGVTVLSSVFDSLTMDALSREATAAYATASRQDCATSDGAEGRGGVPPRSLASAAGGPAQDAVYASTGLHAMLGSLCGVAMVPSGNRGSYSYYVMPGDFLDLHLDVVTCDLTLITVLDDRSAPTDSNGALEAFPDAVGVPLGHVRERADRGGVVVKAAVGESIVILGGLVPHRVLPLAHNSQRVISALCFQIAPGIGPSSQSRVSATSVSALFDEHDRRGDAHGEQRWSGG